MALHKYRCVYGRITMKLSELSQYRKITVQCHDNPDPDALASGWGLVKYFRSLGCDVRFLYSGRFQITKSNLLLMLVELGIPVVYCPTYTIDEDELLLTVDCQYGQGNVTTAQAEHIAVIDHHHGTPSVSLSEVRSTLGSCSTLVWKMMTDEGYDVSSDSLLATALYYGLMTDTGNFTEIYHPLDRDMHDMLPFSKNLISRFCNSNISLNEMVIAGNALVNYTYIETSSCGVIEAAPCDPNILGFISDLALQVDKFDLCVTFNEVSGGYKLSIRSCSKDVHANEFATYITSGIGSGGGHSGKAGGFISKASFERDYPNVAIRDYLVQRVNSYFDNSVVLKASEYEIDTSEMKAYVKKQMKLGYVSPCDFLEIGERFSIRTLEGDVDLVAADDYYIMIGLKGEVYPIKKDKFEKSYRTVDESYDLKTEYFPTIHSVRTGEIVQLTSYVKTCYSSGGSKILAKPIRKIVKIYTAWDSENYMLGNPDDYIACRFDDYHDIYIIAKDIFPLTYEEITE